SSAKAEYRGVANVVAETCWLRNLPRELHTHLSSAMLVYCDNVSVVYLSSNSVQHQHMKHIEIDIHFVRDLVIDAMENLSEPSSSISFTSSSHLSNGSTSYTIPPPLIAEPRSNLEIISLNKLSTNLEKLLSDSGSGSDCNYSDAEVVVEGISVGIHRCILATRSKFFSDLFKESKGCVEKDGKPKYIMSGLLPYGNVGYEAFLVFLSYVYTGKVKASPVEVSTCVDDGCLHVACRPAISFAVELTYAASVFQVPELVSVFQPILIREFSLDCKGVNGLTLF
ncbi:regulatory protein NPR3-like protein, partial [Tanacetum coccineum]